MGFSANCDLEIWPAWNSTIWIKSLISWLKRFSILLNAKIKAYMTWLNFSLLTSMPRKKKHVFWSSLLMSRNWFNVLWTVDWLRCDSEVDKLKPSPWWRILKSTRSYVGSLMNVWTLRWAKWASAAHRGPISSLWSDTHSTCWRRHMDSTPNSNHDLSCWAPTYSTSWHGGDWLHAISAVDSLTHQVC